MSAIPETTSQPPAAPVQAASPHQHHQPAPQAQTPTQQALPLPTPNSAGDQLTCLWQNCGERCATPSDLYDHVCERHVGRKSTNNLNLTCQWGQCRITTVKRDHITSHIRVHVPLKPHKCPTCDKSFKRPQDLKKHQKTHADESVIIRSPEPRNAQHGGGGYSSQSGKHAAELQALAGAASGFYQDGGMSSNSAYGHPNAGAHSGYYSSAPSNSAYGPVYYAVQPSLHTAEYEKNKNAALDALNEFFGEAKRKSIDPAQYYDVGRRFLQYQSQLPFSSPLSAEYQPAPAMVSSIGNGSTPQHQYSLPLPSMPNLRTKSELLDMDQFMHNLQTTVYENPTQAAAAGVAQPGSHYISTNSGYRTSHSPPGHPHTTSSHATNLAPLSMPPSETPALTPASSVMSYTSGQSPGSAHSGNNISPTTRPNVSMYPTLPSVTAMSESSGYPATSNAPNLAPFDSDGRRRWSGNQLQKARPARDENAMDVSEDEKTPNGSRHGSVDRDGLGKDVKKLALNSPTPLDPSLRSPDDQSENSTEHAASESASDREQADRDNEAWVQNMRMIEDIRNFIKMKLERGEFEDDENEVKAEGHDERRESAGPPMSEEERSLYPVLRAVQDGD
ncbi:hypothetical protein K490DRAFT_32951 [Saccharata proteae CBS 121410]|uniref:pH-response transcription factor pacC/RIM101 n=1 Tax=Saccharata proteae CBS 121410 TaxID=1314787 RepID=A0A9P4LYG1_9PEZI|nr:hypothetical protein K490DRAFT_32951 [Saccharata proteae CBS 121410]